MKLENQEEIRYEGKINKVRNHLAVHAAPENEKMIARSIEEIFFEHYYGYKKINYLVSEEYEVNHPRWLVKKVIDFSIDCDFTSMYGSDFSFLHNQQPDSVIIAEGSPVSVNWKRTSF